MITEVIADLGLIAAALFAIPWIHARSFVVRAAKATALAAVQMLGVLLSVPWWLAWATAATSLAVSVWAWHRAVNIQ